MCVFVYNIYVMHTHTNICYTTHIHICYIYINNKKEVYLSKQLYRNRQNLRESTRKKI